MLKIRGHPFEYVTSTVPRVRSLWLRFIPEKAAKSVTTYPYSVTLANTAFYITV